MKEKEWVIDSHRGAFKNGLLENSIPAFTESLAEGANVVECDIRRTKDGKIVLIHNRTIDHISSFSLNPPEQKLKGPVKNHTLQALKSLKFPNNAEILTLEEFLEFLKQKKAGSQIELKEMGFESQILDIIEKAAIDYDSLIGPIVLTSFNFLSIRKLVKLLNKRPNIPKYRYPNQKGLALGLQAIQLGSFYGNAVLRWCQRNNIWGFMTYYKYLPISKIEFAHRCGVKFCPRVPDNPDLIKRYIQADVDGFETDNVPLIKKLIIESTSSIN
jgi:glycerophosphoryl diester phosphodiesterase